MDIFTFFPSWLLPIVLALSFSFIFIDTALRKKSPKASPKLPPSPPKLPIIGNLHQVLGKEMHKNLWKLSENLGPIMLLRLGTQPFLIISSTEMATQVLKTYDYAFCSRPYSRGSHRLSFNYNDVAFSPYGDHWRNMRKLLVSEFLGAKRTLFNKLLEIEMEDLVRSLSLQPINTTVNLDDKLSDLITDVVCKVAIGKSYRGKKFGGKTMKEIVNESILMLNGSFSDVYPTFGWILDRLRGWNNRLEKYFKNLDGFLQTVLDEHVDPDATKTSDLEKDLIDSCISHLNRDEMKAILMNVFNGATDTTTTSLSWTMAEILKNPRVMQKLQKEIRSCIGRKPRVTESDITKMAYLKMVVKESLRLHPPPPFLITRECTSHCQIGGYDIFPGTKVIVNVWVIGRDPRIWTKCPTEFYPERFENMEVDFRGQHFEMVPFGGGRRVCPGFNSAVSTVEFIVANLLYWFDWEAPGEMKNEDLDMEEEGYLLLKRKTPLCLVPKKHVWQN